MIFRLQSARAEAKEFHVFLGIFSMDRKQTDIASATSCVMSSSRFDWLNPCIFAVLSCKAHADSLAFNFQALRGVMYAAIRRRAPALACGESKMLESKMLGHPEFSHGLSRIPASKRLGHPAKGRDTHSFPKMLGQNAGTPRVFPGARSDTRRAKERGHPQKRVNNTRGGFTTLEVSLTRMALT
jgi:hypothetical protein